jgi:hypothetical protein
MLFITNEGDDTVRTTAAIDGETSLIAFDLWRGEYRRKACRAEDGRTVFSLELEARESILYLLDDSGAFPAEPDWDCMYVPVTFTLVSDDEANFIKTYEGVLHVDAPMTRDIGICVQAEEMVECYVNGTFADVSFWNTHRFRLSDYLVPGDNRIVLTVTGNAANRFTGHRIPYGLTDSENR